MEYPCFHKGCQDPSTLACYCEEVPIICCSQHYGVHVTQKRESNHLPVNLEIEIQQKDQSKFIEYFQNILNKEIQVKSQILNLVKEIADEAKKIIFNSLKKCSKLKHIIKNIKTKGTILFLKSKESNQKFLNEEALMDFKILIEENKIENLKYFKLNDNNVSLASNDTSEIVAQINTLNQYERAKIIHDFFYFIKHETKTLVGLNLTDFTERRYTLNFLPHGLSAPCILQLDEDKLFIHGGRYTNNNYSNKTILLDMKKLENQKMPSGIENSYSKPILINNKIYIFGGISSNGIISTSQMFKMDVKIWKRIADLPKPSKDISSIDLKDKILISGDNCFCLYNIMENDYEIIDNNIEISFTNILLKYDGKVFLLTEAIYECNENKIKNWVKINQYGLEFGNIISSGILRNNFFYFTSWKGFIFRFDCKTKRVKILREIE